MEHMRRIAYETVLRACGFGSLAIFCVMIGMSFEPRAGIPGRRLSDHPDVGILIFKAHEALTKNYRKTEMWLYLPKEQRPAGRTCPVGERNRAARNLSHLRTVDRRDCDCDVGAGTALLVRRQN